MKAGRLGGWEAWMPEDRGYRYKRSLIEKRNFEKANIEYRIMNVECRSKVFCLFYKKMTEQSDSALRHSAVRYSIFCGSLFKPFI
jgi:hypothetical protein